MKRRQYLGQHFLNSDLIAKKIVHYAEICKKDIVYEIGTGKGILIPFLCEQAGKVISIDSDKKLYQSAISRFSKIPNLTLLYGDGFKFSGYFSILVSNLPYSKSRVALEWLIQKKFSTAVIMVQKEFGDKLFGEGKDRRAISILANYATNIEKLMTVKKNNFSPAPKVDSSLLQFKRKHTISEKLIKSVNNLFSYRRKQIHNITKQFGKKSDSDKRLEDLSGDEIIKIAKQIQK